MLRPHPLYELETNDPLETTESVMQTVTLRVTGLRGEVETYYSVSSHLDLVVQVGTYGGTDRISNRDCYYYSNQEPLYEVLETLLLHLRRGKGTGSVRPYSKRSDSVGTRL